MMFVYFELKIRRIKGSALKLQSHPKFTLGGTVSVSDASEIW